MECVIYARFSPRRDEETSLSIEGQVSVCRQHAKAEKWTVTEVYTDAAVSGAEVNRPNLWWAIEATPKGGVLLVHQLDRLARDEMLMFQIEDIVARKGARIVSIGGDDTGDQSPDAKLLRTLKSAINAYQRRVNAARTQAAMLAHQRNGRSMGGEPPFGWELDPDGPISATGRPIMMRPCTTEQMALNQVRHLARQKRSAYAIAKRLNEQNITTRTGGYWRCEQVVRILEREGFRETRKPTKPDAPRAPRSLGNPSAGRHHETHPD